MKKFSILLIGAFLLWTITFVLADESKDDKALSGSIAEMPESINSSLNETSPTESTTWDTTESSTTEATDTTSEETATTWDTTEVKETATAETTSTEATETTSTEATDTITTGETTTETNETTANTADTTTPTISDSAKQKYNEEQIAAYEWAYKNGITTINDADKARLADGLTRAELAKMMSQYMTKVLWKTPATTEEKVVYSDVDESLGDLADFIQIAYAYKIMWINSDGTPLENFNPNGLVTRAEYATVFSRVLYGDKYNKSEWNYYEDHLAALKEAGILTNTTPTIQEIRGWVMLMMYRSVNAKSETTEETTQIANPASEYCVAQWGTINIVKDEEGNESGMCKLSDGTEVDEWEYYRANNPATETWTTAEEPTTEETTSEENTEAWTGEVATWSTLTVTVTPNKE